MRERASSERVVSSPDSRGESREDYGRQLAMDSILQDACAGMVGAPELVAAGGRPRRRPLLVGAACVAASILAVWAILWMTDTRNPSADPSAAAGETVPGPAGELVASRHGGATDSTTENTGAATESGVAAEGSPRSGPNPALAAAQVLQRLEQAAPGEAKPSPEPRASRRRRAIPTPNAEGQIVIPEGTDPADIRMLRSAQAMLDAEKKIADLVRRGLLGGATQRWVPFEEISSWKYQDGLECLPEKLKPLDGKKVMMTGLMLPIDEVENIRQFLLVESLWSCCYGEPPDINGIVRVVVKGAKATDYTVDPIKLVGTFRIQPTVEDGFCVDIYQLEVEKVEVIE